MQQFNLSPVQNLRTFPLFHSLATYFPLAGEGIASLDSLFSNPAKDAADFHEKAGELAYSFLQSTGESPQKKWLAVFVYSKGYAIHDGKVWDYQIFTQNGTQRIVQSLQASC